MTSGPPPSLAALLALMPFSQALGVILEKAEQAEVVGTLAWGPERCTAGGVLHGGAVMALADSLGGVCAYLNLPPRASTSTIESKTNFFRGVRTGLVRGVARPVHAGRSTIVIQTELADADGRPVGLVIQTQAVLAAEKG